jgi:hypothetical protein
MALQRCVRHRGRMGHRVGLFPTVRRSSAVTISDLVSLAA